MTVARLVSLPALCLAASSCGPQTQPPASQDRAPVEITPAVETEKVSKDPDDPAIWVHPTDPSRSLILGTNKAMAPSGAVVVFRLDGKTVQTFDGLNRPNNVDVASGFDLGGKRVDIAVTAERLAQRMRVFAVSESGIRDITTKSGIPVFAGEDGDAAAAMGVALYRRPSDGALFVILSRKTGPSGRYLWQYRLSDDGQGGVKAEKIREFGQYSGKAEIEAVAVDAELGYVYYADENDSIRKYRADPDHAGAAQELARFGTTGFKLNHEGIAIYRTGPKTGFIVCTDQQPGASDYRIFRREGTAANPHDHSELVAVLHGKSDSTDGIAATEQALGPAFPEGVLVTMNSSGKTFHLYRWRMDWFKK